MALSVAVVTVNRAHRRASRSVCDLVEEHYFRSRDSHVREWLGKCRESADGGGLFVSRREAIARINALLSALNVSHLFLYTPDENRALWDQEALDTGLRARNIEGHFVIHEAVPGSAGDRAGVQVGDEFLKVDGYDIASVDEIAMTSGTYEGLRSGRRVVFEIRAEPLSLDLKPSWEELGTGTFRLRVPSLLARYFDREEWVAVAARLRNARHVILDLRGNPGGSFPAMLRVASGFFCEETRIGTILQPKNEPHGNESDLADELSADAQLEQLDGLARLHLRTFSEYPCYDGDVTVLVDAGTSSVAEILAESFSSRPRARVWGMPTSGQVVMAQWFPVYGLGGGDYSVSIPIAGYRTRSGLEMEDQGLVPERLLYYDLQDAVRGRDTWLETARKDTRF